MQSVQSTPPVIDPDAPSLRQIAIHVVLKWLAANPDAGFTSLMFYDVY